MKKIVLFSLFAFSTLQAQHRPKLVVGIVVDQMKAEYLDRFYNDFSADGFKKLLDKGFNFRNTHYNYMPTSTAPGHASIYTGTTPSVHGIMGNDWFNRQIGKQLYCTDDASVIGLGETVKNEGLMSPRNLKATTITDELRLSTNFRGKVVGVSLKDRGSILPAGHFANWAFWYSNSGSFISSTFYGEKLPDWVIAFNMQKNFQKYLENDWNLLKPLSVYDESLPDNNSYESELFKQKPVFPYKLKEMYLANGPEIIRSLPFGNDFLAEFAKEAIENEQLGKDNITDFLTLSFSATDYVGHDFGTRSKELQDTYLRLDLTIADFLTYLDKTVGKGNYLLFLTADHAAPESVSLLNKDLKYTVSNVKPKDIREALKKFSIDAYGENLVKHYLKYNIHFDRELLQAKGLSLEDVKQKFKVFLLTQPQIKRVFTEEEILSNSDTDFFLKKIYRGYDPVQNGDLVILDKPGFMQNWQETGNDHATPYSYDTHVPLLFYGWNIKRGKTHDRKDITQIAPTIAQKISITLPNGTEANVLTEVLDEKK